MVYIINVKADFVSAFYNVHFYAISITESDSDFS